MNIRINCIFLFLIFLSAGNLNAKIVILGCDSSGQDEFNFVSDEIIPAGTVIYFSEEHYDAANNQFGNVEGTVSYTVPSSGLPAGKVVVIIEVTGGNLTADDGGTVVLVAGNWSLSGNEEEITAFTVSNPASPLNSVNFVYCWFILDGGAGVGSNQDPSQNYPECIVQNWIAQLDRGQYIRDRSLPTSISDIQDLSNWSFGGSTMTMNSTDFSGPFTLGEALPIVWTSFRANQMESSIQLHWETQNEINNYGFEVERSSDLKNWNKIEFISGNGSISQQSLYSFIDNSPKLGGNYYRLKQIDFNGWFEYSKIVMAEVKSLDNLFKPKVYPNPVRGEQVNILFPEQENKDELSFRLISLQGKLVGQWKKSYYQNTSLDLDGISNGIYILEINKGNNTWREKLIL